MQIMKHFVEVIRLGVKVRLDETKESHNVSIL